MVCFHEQLFEKTRFNWYTAKKHELTQGIDSAFDGYWTFIAQQLQTYRILGDANSWTPSTIPDLDSRFGVDQVIYLVRNGIQNVHSFFYHSARISRDDWLYTHFHRRYWEILGCPGGDWDNYTDWARWCFYWQINQAMPAWLADQLGGERVLIYRFEDLLHDSDVLAKLIEEINPEARLSAQELKVLQQTDINQKIRGDRSPEAIWSQWTDEQREVFKRICGPGMEHYGYSIPPRPFLAGSPLRFDPTFDVPPGKNTLPKPGAHQRNPWRRVAGRVKRAMTVLLNG